VGVDGDGDGDGVDAGGGPAPRPAWRPFAGGHAGRARRRGSFSPRPTYRSGMNPRLDRARVVGRAILHEVRTEKITFLAGSIAYHAFLSLLPLFLLVLAVIATVGNATLEESFIAVARAVLTEGASDLLVAELRSTSTSVSLFGVVVLVWGTLRIFRGLDTAFSDIYESEAANTFADQLMDGLVVLGTFALALIAAALVESVLSLGEGPAGWLLRRALLVVGLSVVFLPMYLIFPDEDVSVVEVLPGVLLASVGLTAFESLFRFYVDLSGRSGDSGVVAGILVLLTWLYFSGLVILLGAVVNAVLSNRSDDVSIDPVVGGVDRDPATVEAESEAAQRGVERLVALLRDRPDADRVTVEVDGERVELPRPDEVRADTGRLVPGSGVGVEFEWRPPLVADADGADSSAGTTGDDD
jgi:membrane protein